MINQNFQKIEKLKTLLEKTGKHTQYQTLPNEILNGVNDLKNLKIGGYQDYKRYDWLIKHLDTLSGNVIDIGANQGFFTTTILKDFPVKVTAYEPFKPHAEGIEILKDLLGFNNEDLNILNQGIGIEQIDELPYSDLLIFLNVLHHAGKEFDNDLINNINDWEDYAISYLRKLKSKTNKMFFQLGYAWGGDNERLCNDEEIISFTSNLLIKAGWNIIKVGIITKYTEPIFYEDYNYEDLKMVNSLKLNNSLISKIFNRLKKNHVEMPFRFAQRPLWLCN
jgi:hypothetical protein